MQALTALPPAGGDDLAVSGVPVVAGDLWGCERLLLLGPHGDRGLGRPRARLVCGSAGPRSLGVLVAVFEASTVIVLRAHYTMDVFTGARRGPADPGSCRPMGAADRSGARPPGLLVLVAEHDELRVADLLEERRRLHALPAPSLVSR